LPISGTAGSPQFTFFSGQNEEDPAGFTGDAHLFVRAETCGERIPATMQTIVLQCFRKRGFRTTIDLYPVRQVINGVAPDLAGIGIAED